MIFERRMFMWLLYAIGSALFAGIVSILVKIGIKNVDSNLATALRTIVVAVFAWLMVFIVDRPVTFQNIPPRSFIFLILSGLATGGSWLCYFRALQIGDVNKVTPIDKSSTVLTILLSIIFFHEDINVIKILAIILISIGTLLMIEKKEQNSNTQKNAWIVYAIFSAVLASLSAILGKVGVTNISSTLGTAIRTIVVLVMAWLIVFLQHKQTDIKLIDRRSWLFIIFSGIATGLSWLCYYRALQDGPASVVVPIDKLSIIITIAFSYFILNEKLTKKALFGLILIVAGTLSLLL